MINDYEMMIMYRIINRLRTTIIIYTDNKYWFEEEQIRLVPLPPIRKMRRITPEGDAAGRIIHR